MEKNTLLRSGQQHAKIRQDIRKFIKKGTKLVDIANFVENKIKKATKFNQNKPLEAGIAFPVGIGVNNIAAHWAPPADCKQVVTKDDLITVDFGLHYGGQITDSAFTMSLSDRYDQLMEINKEAVYAGIKASGPDVRLSDVGKAIGEVLNNAEVEIDGKLTPVKVVTSLCGHKILPYKIHGFKAVPNKEHLSYPERMVEGEVYAIEPFVTTGKSSTLQEEIECNHYMVNYFDTSKSVQNTRLTGREKSLLNYINHNYSTLCFDRKWLNSDRIIPLSLLSRKGLLQKYPVISDRQGTYVSQFEHNIYINDTAGKKPITILTKGSDW